MTIKAVHESPIGALTLVCQDDALIGLYFEDHKVGGPPADARDGMNPVIEAARRQLDEYFAGRRLVFDVPVSPRGTDFQRRVWTRLRAIPYGESITYGALASELGAPNAARAVGAAVGRNPVSIVIPCHRVLGSNGALTGFAGGLERKQKLLSVERGGQVSQGAAKPLLARDRVDQVC